MDVDGPAAVPAGPDRGEFDDPALVGDLGAAQVPLVVGGDEVGVPTATARGRLRPGVQAARVAVPDLDHRVRDRPARLAVLHLQGEPQLHALFVLAVRVGDRLQGDRFPGGRRDGALARARRDERTQSDRAHAGQQPAPADALSLVIVSHASPIGHRRQTGMLTSIVNKLSR
ncbi:hypothetical protein GCM10017567_85280 [Amycolatopsis bullii]|uniref:Uncharacterized protein n=1 Tax=Amycolatopsis bullii TaxID=941987 RepID=A0ABQ3KVI4_9PSEU|nr:hypothetical protein GCM10017567_85280 [Amycolatopsis bullii]